MTTAVAPAPAASAPRFVIATPKSRRDSRYIIAAAVVCAALLRLAWAIWIDKSLEGDGAEYARIAENLLAGRGYVGVFANGTQLNFPPLYPVLIALVSLVLPSAEIAARVVNVVFGAALVIPVFRITEELYGRRAAIVATIVVTLHPVLLVGSASAFSEFPYLTLLLSALYWLIRWITTQRTRSAGLAGAFLGLAYLVRPEAFLLAGEFTVLGLVAALVIKGQRSLLRGALLLPLAFGVVASPNIIFLARATGTLRLQAKGTLAYEWGRRVNLGESYQEAVKGIGDDLSEQGVFMRSNREVVASVSYTTRDYLAYAMRAAQRNVGTIERTIVDERALGSPLLFGLIVLALFGTGWGKQRLLTDGVLLITTGTMVAVLLGTVQAIWLRFFFPLVGIFAIWMAKGACDLGDWAADTAGSMTGNERRLQDIRIAATGLSIVAVLGLAWWGIGDVSHFREAACAECVSAGRWLAKQSSSHKWVMAGEVRVAYYAGADLMYLPYARPELAIRYIAKRHPDFIVLDDMSAVGFPYARDWLARGIPDARAELIHEEQGPNAQIKIYRWRDLAPTP
jgi:hypothetical protein